MNVLHLSTFDVTGGAARAAFRQHTALRLMGVESEMLVRFKASCDPQVRGFGAGTKTERLKRAAIRFARQRESKSIISSGKLKSNQLPISSGGDVGVEVKREMSRADVINLHLVHGFVDLKPLFLEAIPAKVPIVCTMHDMSWFTGGCGYAGDCDGFQEGCGRCPLLNSQRADDLSSKHWRIRKECFQSRKISFVADSNWLAGEARKSSLLKEQDVSVIHYGIDQTVFRPFARNEAKRALNLLSDRKVVLAAAASLSDPRKGIQDLVDSLTSFGNPQSFHLVTVGGAAIPVSSDDLRYTHLGAVQSDELLSLVYRAADVFVMPSHQEAFGQTALEAAACGTPVVAYDAGGPADIVIPNVNGKLVETRNVAALSSSIGEVLEDENLCHDWPTKAEQWTAENFSYEINAAKYCSLYETLLGK